MDVEVYISFVLELILAILFVPQNLIKNYICSTTLQLVWSFLILLCHAILEFAQN